MENIISEIKNLIKEDIKINGKKKYHPIHIFKRWKTN